MSFILSVYINISLHVFTPMALKTWSKLCGGGGCIRSTPLDGGTRKHFFLLITPRICLGSGSSSWNCFVIEVFPQEMKHVIYYCLVFSVPLQHVASVFLLSLPRLELMWLNIHSIVGWIWRRLQMETLKVLERILESRDWLLLFYSNVFFLLYMVMATYSHLGPEPSNDRQLSSELSGFPVPPLLWSSSWGPLYCYCQRA